MNKLKKDFPVLYHIIRMIGLGIWTVGLVTIILQWSAGYYIERDFMWAIFAAACAIYWLGVGDNEL